MANTYKFRQGASIKGDPQIVGEHLELLRTKAPSGKLTPDDVLADAANPNSPLHPSFDWDDTEAARNWRLNQARQLVASVVVVYRRSEGAEPQTVRAFVSVRTEEGRGYVPTFDAMSDEDLRRQTLLRAWNEMQSFRKRYGDLAEFASIFASLPDIEAALPPVVRAA